ncbi:MAG: adenylate/guanylate cyclase domain-containing protein [Betaproteobacteria bacterium]|nr:adenylate/guanylate cyclase domain-containing protein [Betaproteobacteria bacterium]
MLFADVAGSTRIYEKLGDTAALQAVDRCLKRVQRAVEAYRGRVVKTIGDELMAVFGSVDEAFQAAAEMQQRVSDLPLVSGVKLEIRVGFQHGPVIEEAGDVFGDCVNTAARLSGLAKPGQVLIGGQTQRALSVPLQMSTRDMGRMSVKGKADELHVFEAIWQQSDELTMKATRVRLNAGLRDTQLHVRYGERLIVLDDAKPAMDIGRDADCDIPVRDRRASRNHARIERRGGKFVLIDQSTNGTYVTFAGEDELFLRREELVLRGGGRICFAAPAAGADADSAEFEIV